MNNLILIRGLPGSGKSTFGRTLCVMNDQSKQFEADDYFIDEESKEYRFD